MQVDGLVGTAEGLELGHCDRRAIATAVFASLSLCHCCGNLQRALQPSSLLVDCYVAEGSWDETKAPCSTPTNIAIVAIPAASQVDSPLPLVNWLIVTSQRGAGMRRRLPAQPPPTLRSLPLPLRGRSMGTPMGFLAPASLTTTPLAPAVNTA